MSDEKHEEDFRAVRQRRFSAMIEAEKKKIEERALAEEPVPPSSSIGNQFFDMLNNAIQYNNQPMRIVHIEDKPWFRGKDVASILEYSDVKKTLQLHVPARYKQNYGQLLNSISDAQTTPEAEFAEDSRTIYISEAGLTRLVMKSQMSAAVAFQDWVTDELLPSLRQNRQREIEEWKEYYEKRLELKNKSILNLVSTYEQMEVMNKVYGEKEYIYIVASYQYCINGVFKIGRTKNIKHRLAQYNTGRADCDKVLVLNTFEVYNAVNVEKQIHETLLCIQYTNSNELYRCPYKFLVELVKNIVEDNQNNYEYVNQLLAFIAGLNRAKDSIWSDEITNQEFVELHKKYRTIKAPEPRPAIEEVVQDHKEEIDHKEAPPAPPVAAGQNIVIHNVEQLQLYVQQQSGGELRWCELIKHISKRLKIPRKNLRDLVQQWCSSHNIEYKYR